jgi:transposase
LDFFLAKVCKLDHVWDSQSEVSACVSEKAGRWFVSLQVEEEIPPPTNKPNIKIGVDLGIKQLATTSDCEIFDNPKALRTNLKKLQRLSRRVSRIYSQSLDKDLLQIMF